MRSTLAAATLSILLVGCAAGPDADDVQRVEMSFQDSSVPPEYHRSTTVTVEPGSVTLTISGYEGPLASSTAEISDADFRNLVDDLAALPDAPDDALCPGGSVTSVILLTDDGTEHAHSSGSCSDAGADWQADVQRASDQVTQSIGVADTAARAEEAWEEQNG